MNNDFISKAKKFISFLLIASIFVCISYLLVYKVSFLPNGYDIEAVQKYNVSLKSFNFLGVEKNRITLSFSENNIWLIDEIKNAVKRQKGLLFMLFSSVTVSIFLLSYKVRNGLKLWKAVLESNIIFAVLFPLPLVMNSLNRISDLISYYSTNGVP